MKRKVILLPGMTPGTRLFDKLLPQLENGSSLDWIPPGSSRTIGEYARKLAEESGIDSSCDLVGVSFGGMVAQELSRHLGSRLCFVVSSVGSSCELRPTQRIFSHLPHGAGGALLRTVGTVAHLWPRQASNASTVRARKFGGNHGEWFRWATSAALRWRPGPCDGAGVVRIHGDRDRTFPHGHHLSDHVVAGAGHMLAMTHSHELATIIRQRQEQEER